MLAPHYDVFEIKHNEYHEDVKRKLFLSDILVFDHIDSNQMKFISSFFYNFSLSQPELNACFIIRNDTMIDCIN